MIWAIAIPGIAVFILAMGLRLFAEFGPGIVIHPIAGYQGRRAFHRGLVMGANPYNPWTARREYRAWRIAFKDERVNDWIHYGTDACPD